MTMQRESEERARPVLGVAPDDRWIGRDILSVDQFGPEDLDRVFAVAHEMREVVSRIGTFDLLKGQILANLFYEPSTRTASSFHAAMARLGGDVISIQDVRYSSVAKGESLPDTVRTLERYSDVIVLRHPENGAAAEAARWASKPVINAGDGTGEHPTQALLDLFTIVEERAGQRPDGLSVVMVGDLKFGRTVHSLSRLLSLYDVRLRLVSPPSQAMPQKILDELQGRDVEVTGHHDLDEVLAEADVLYVTRVQKERFEDLALYEQIKHRYVVTAETMDRAPDHMILMHPFPRVGEIAPEVDEDPRAAYFRQMGYGLYVRMALLAMVLGKA